ncbi:hypothetical protein BC827DRAFT_1161837, partial [Russula dissimulans]
MAHASQHIAKLVRTFISLLAPSLISSPVPYGEIWSPHPHPRSTQAQDALTRFTVPPEHHEVADQPITICYVPLPKI